MRMMLEMLMDENDSRGAIYCHVVSEVGKQWNCLQRQNLHDLDRGGRDGMKGYVCGGPPLVS